jgi:hypothetical protein
VFFLSRFYSIERFDLDRSIDEVRVTYLFKWADLSNIMHIFYLLRLSRVIDKAVVVFSIGLFDQLPTPRNKATAFFCQSPSRLT